LPSSVCDRAYEPNTEFAPALAAVESVAAGAGAEAATTELELGLPCPVYSGLSGLMYPAGIGPVEVASAQGACTALVETVAEELPDEALGAAAVHD
jgi:hypothetical protein